MSPARLAVAALILVHIACVREAGAAVSSTPATRVRIADPALQSLVDRLAPTLFANEKRFTGATGPVAGFGAGATYPQIWLRDSATLVDLARYHFPPTHLTSWVEEHLAHQQPDGSLFDWIAAGPAASFAEWAPQVRLVHGKGPTSISADKNTVEADQESSAVIAAARAFAFTGDVGWLRKPIAGRTLLQRCDAALAFLMARRRDAATGLVTSGFAADWGDVSPTYPDQRVIYLDENTPRVVGLYTNALAYEAAVGLAGLHDAAGDRARGAHWRKEAERLQAAVDAALWQPQAGFYRMSAPAAGPAFKADVTGILGMGGHAAALRAGLVTGDRARDVLDTLEARRASLQLRTVSFSLLPPFPAGLFQHPAVKEPWSYQNGGQWDWFGGRLLAAEFALGRAGRARGHLRELAEKVLKSGGLFEWHTKDGEGRGSPEYAGSAGALGAAVIEGLMGVHLRPDGLELRPRAGQIGIDGDLYDAASASRVRYGYRPLPHEIELVFGVAPRRPTRVAVLLPTGWKAVDARLEGRPVTVRLETVGADRYACVDTDGERHRLTLRSARSPRVD